MQSDSTLFSEVSITILGAYPPLQAYFVEGNGMVQVSLQGTVSFTVAVVTGSGSNLPIFYSWNCTGTVICAAVSTSNVFSLPAVAFGLGVYTLNAYVSQGNSYSSSGSLYPPLQ